MSNAVTERKQVKADHAFPKCSAHQSISPSIVSKTPSTTAVSTMRPSSCSPPFKAGTPLGQALEVSLRRQLPLPRRSGSERSRSTSRTPHTWAGSASSPTLARSCNQNQPSQIKPFQGRRSHTSLKPPIQHGYHLQRRPFGRYHTDTATPITHGVRQVATRAKALSSLFQAVEGMHPSHPHIAFG